MSLAANIAERRLLSWDISLSNKEHYGCIAYGVATAVATVVALGAINSLALTFASGLGVLIWFGAVCTYKTARVLYEKGVQGNEWLIAATVLSSVAYMAFNLAGLPLLTLRLAPLIILAESSMAGMMGTLVHDGITLVQNALGGSSRKGQL